MIPIDAKEVMRTQYSNPFKTVSTSKVIPPPLMYEFDESQDSFYMESSPLNRSEGEIGGDHYMAGLKNFKQPEPGMVKKMSNKLG